MPHNSPENRLPRTRGFLKPTFTLACAVVLFLAAVSFVSASSLSTNDSSQDIARAKASIEGTLTDASSAPIAGATLLLQDTNGRNAATAKTDARGTFDLSPAQPGTYTLRAQKAGWTDGVLQPIVLMAGEQKQLVLVFNAQGVLKIRQSTPSKSSSQSAAGAMEFTDEPSFTVAGVTDWSNLGLHGSAATSRTSESLAKQTVTLHANGTTSNADNSLDKRYEEAIASRDKGDLAGARDTVRKVLAASDDAAGHRLLGELDEQLGDSLESVHEYENAARMSPSEQNYFEWGAELLLHKAYDPAVEVFTRGTIAYPRSARMLTGLGAALFARGSVEDAARRLCEASDLQPLDTAPYLFLGKIEKTVAEPLPCSEQKLAHFVAQQPQNPTANYFYAISLWKREKSLADAGGAPRAEMLLEKAVTLDPKFADAYLELGVVRTARGEADAGIGDYQKAIEINPHLGEAHRQLGLACQRKGDIERAKQEFAAYEQAEKLEAAEVDREQKDLRQFLIILKDQKSNAPPQ